MKGSRVLLLKFWDSLYISGTVWARNFNLALRLITGGTNDKNEKLGQMGSWRGHVTYFWNFGTPSPSQERFKLETSNLAGRVIARGTNERNAKLGQRGLWMGQVAYFSNFGTHILGTVEDRNFKFGRQERNANLCQGLWLGHVTYFWNFRSSFISIERFKLETYKSYSIGKMGWAIPNVALSATLYIAFRLRDPARLCSRELLNSGGVHQYTTLNLRSSTKKILYW